MFFAVSGLSRLRFKLPALPQSSARAESSEHAALVADRLLRPAPRFVAVSGDRYYTATSAKAAAEGADSGQVDELAAYELSSGKELWKVSVDLVTENFIEADGFLICQRQYLSEPPHFELTAFNAADGSAAWQRSFDLASEGALVPTAKSLVAHFRMSDGFRIVGVDPKNGEKAWGIKPKLAGVNTIFVGSGQLWLELQAKKHIAAYKFGNVVGIVDLRRGKLLREYATSDLIHSVEIDPGAECCFLLARGAQENAFALERLPFKGSPQNLLRFKADGELPSILSETGFLALAYNAADSAGEYSSRLFVFKSRQTGYVDHEFTEGYVYDVQPDPLSDKRLLVLTRHDENVERKTGHTVLHEFDLESGEVAELRQIGGPCETAWVVKGDLLLSTLRGELLRYSVKDDRVKKLKRPRFDHSQYMYSPLDDRTVMLSSSYPAGEWEPGGKLQLIVYE